MELEQLSQFVWENTKMVVVQMQFPEVDEFSELSWQATQLVT
jgi:hypothetical protein